jgi:hypothetical protein
VAIASICARRRASRSNCSAISQAALALARENWTVQKELPDLRLLVESALASATRQPWTSVRQWLAQWARSEDVVINRLLSLGGRPCQH